MPQARPEIRKLFKDDKAAWNVLSKLGFTEKDSVIQLPGRELTEKEVDTIEYLITEWDWDYF